MHYQLVAKAADFTPEELQKKTSVHFDNFEFKGIGRYKDVISSPQGVYAYISSDGQIYYMTNVRCPFEPHDVVYVMDCHN